MLGNPLQPVKTPSSRPVPLHTATATPAPSTATRRRLWRLLSKRGWLWTRLATDTLLLVAAILAARLGAPSDIGTQGNLAVWLLLPGVLLLLAARGLYGGAIESRTIEMTGRIVSAT